MSGFDETSLLVRGEFASSNPFGQGLEDDLQQLATDAGTCVSGRFKQIFTFQLAMMVSNTRLNVKRIVQPTMIAKQLMVIKLRGMSLYPWLKR